MRLENHIHLDRLKWLGNPNFKMKASKISSSSHWLEQESRKLDKQFIKD